MREERLMTPNDPFDSNFKSAVKDFCCYFNLSMTLLLISGMTFVLIKIRLRNIDRVGVITLTAYSACSILQSVTWIQYLMTGKLPDDFGRANAVFYLMSLLASIVIWQVLYFFVFEMKTVKVKLQSQTLDQMNQEVASVRRERFVLLTISTVLMVCIFYINAQWSIGDYYTDAPNHYALQLCDYIFRVLKVILIDVYIIVTFFDTFWYFLSWKKLRLLRAFQSFTRFNRFMIVWIWIIAVLNFLHSL